MLSWRTSPSRNFILDSDLSIKFCDFTESSIMPLHVNMETADDNGYPIQTDIGQLGAVMYEIVTGERCEFGLFKDLSPEVGRATWPRREALPSTRNIWLGRVIEKCWTEGAFHDAHSLSEALESLSLITEDDGPTKGNEAYNNRDAGPSKRTVHVLRHLGTAFRRNVSRRPMAALAVTVGAITVLATSVWGHSYVQ
ncbi:hypothetical protein VTN00DRAFT_7719 [Thermoascus crustaceus]|uniref:uncharacterized protein n=1 Tax=Thermoascus crustaceus TaxID=5088 RepID=UPI0037420332